MREKRKKTQYLLWGGFFLSAVVLALSAYMLLSSYLEYREGASSYDALQKEAAAYPIEQRKGSDHSADTAEEALTVSVKDFSGLLARNKDCVAWLELPDTAIDYPAVQGVDNAYYLSHLFSGEQNKCGSLFVDYRNSKDFTDKNTIIYGHHMKDGSMFAALENFKKQSFYDDHPEFFLYTPGETYRLEPFAGLVITAERDNLPLSFDAEDAFLSYIETSRENSTFESDVEVTTDDRIVTLCTCTYDFTNARFALLCRLERISQAGQAQTVCVSPSM